MANRNRLNKAISELAGNPEQCAAVQESGHCVVLAGPGSGKTKTLTIAMARALLEDVEEPRGIACITYNNECAIELETRLAQLGIESSENIFIGTVHSFALTQVILPYARCVLPELSSEFRVATKSECSAVIESAYRRVINANEKPSAKWKYAETKRRRDVNRNHPDWRDKNPELATFIEAYETELRSRGLIDFDDMPLLALRMVREHAWIRNALQAKYPILFVDEYQDLGHALHELVQLLCFKADIRLFAVGDPDQSIYGFTGANPQLLKNLANQANVKTIQLRFNYRCGRKIIDASMAALGEERGYQGKHDAAEGVIDFHPIPGDLDAQAQFIFSELLPNIRKEGMPLEEIAILYRTAKHGEEVAACARKYQVPIIRADTNALVKRSCRLSRFIQACAVWVTVGWKRAEPPFRRLSAEATTIVFGFNASEEEKQQIQVELMQFLQSIIEKDIKTHQFLRNFQNEVLFSWRSRARTITENWSAIEEMIRKTDPTLQHDADLPLTHFGGKFKGVGALNLSTLHSAKGREFDAVILFAMNDDVIPNWHDKKGEIKLREARRLFYVGVTRARHRLYIVFKYQQNSNFVLELYKRITCNS